jgi:hypothetical protein
MTRSQTNLRRAFVGLIVIAWSAATTSVSRADAKIYDKLVRSTGLVVVPQENNSSSVGTCWVADREHKLAVTNQHVVGKGTEALIYFPMFQNGDVVSDYAAYRKGVAPIHARVVHSDSRHDLALLQLDSLPESIPELSLTARSSRPGETIHSIGNSGVGSGELWRYSTGKVRLVYSAKMPKESGAYEGRLLETDAPTNKGDSGGPIVNDAGELVGVVMCYEVATRLISGNVDVSEVKTFLKDGREALNPASFRAVASSLLGGAKSTPTVVGNWKLNFINLDGEQKAGQCLYRSDGSFEMTAQSAKGPVVNKGWYGYANGMLIVVCPGFELNCRAHWVKNDRFTLLASDGLLILDRQPAAATVVANEK